MKILRKFHFGNGATSPLFLPTLFFIAGIRTPEYSRFGIVIFAVAFIFLALHHAAISIFRKKSAKIFPTRIVLSVIVLSLSTFAGALCRDHRCKGKEDRIFPATLANVVLDLKANVVTSKKGKHGIFYGYGIIKDASEKVDILKNERIFFSVDSVYCEEIPVCGQKFKVRGNLKFVAKNNDWWFWKHLKNSHIDWSISNCCLIACDAKVPPLGTFFRKIFNRFLDTIEVGVGDKKIETGIMTAMLTGWKQKMDKKTRTMFRNLGIGHLFAVSGIHIGIIGMAIDFVLKFIGVRKIFRIFFALVILTFYVNTIGCSPSSVRALTMVMFYATSSMFGRRPNVLAALTNSALVHILYDPFVVFSISFLLSYSVVAGIILIGSPLKMFLSGIFLNLHGIGLGGYSPADRALFGVKKALIASFALSCGSYLISLPLSVEHFGVVSLLTILINMLIIPIASCAIVTGATALLFGLFGLWVVCAPLNRLACSMVHVLRVLTQNLYFDSCCYRNVTFPLVSGASATMLVLVCAYLLVAGRKPRREVA
jgi:competence protein ComEC